MLSRPIAITTPARGASFLAVTSVILLIILSFSIPAQALTFAIVGDSWTTYCPESYFTPYGTTTKYAYSGATLPQILSNLQQTPAIQYDAVFIIGGLANYGDLINNHGMSVAAALVTTAEQQNELACFCRYHFQTNEIAIYNVPRMIEWLDDPDNWREEELHVHINDAAYESFLDLPTTMEQLFPGEF